VLPYREVRVADFYLLTVEKEPGQYRLYVGSDGEHYCHYAIQLFQDLLLKFCAVAHRLEIGQQSLNSEPDCSQPQKGLADSGLSLYQAVI